jgi:Zn-dependent M28 family amino/carboxypeptidase
MVFPGAQDNASAVAIVLDVLRRANTRPHDRNILVLFPGCEEPPDFGKATMGSRWFVEHPPVPLREISLAIVLDVMGAAPQPYLGGVLWVTGAESDETLASLVRGVEARPLAEPIMVSTPLFEGVPGFRRRPEPESDYDSFRRRRIPFLFLSRGRSRVYHTSEDKPDTCQFDAMADSAAWLTDLVLSAADEAATFPKQIDPRRVDPEHDGKVLEEVYRRIEAGRAEIAPKTWERLGADAEAVRAITRRLDNGEKASPHAYRVLQLAALRLQCVAVDPKASICSAW